MPKMAGAHTSITTPSQSAASLHFQKACEEGIKFLTYHSSRHLRQRLKRPYRTRDNLLAALEHLLEQHDRVRSVSLSLTLSQIAEVVRKMQEPFPALTYFHLKLIQLSGQVTPFLPDGFLGASARVYRNSGLLASFSLRYLPFSCQLVTLSTSTITTYPRLFHWRR